MSALERVAPLLACPRCGADMTVEHRALRCTEGHSHDLARQGYVNLLSRPAGAAADTAAMVADRAHVLEAGTYSPITDALREVVTALDLPAGCLVDVGAGTGHYAAQALDALAGRDGIALDLSAYAARRAAKAHPRLAALVADAWQPLPVRTGAAAVVLDVFAPRNPVEFARVLAPGGAVLVVTPAADHLHELVEALDLPRVDPHKAERLAEAFSEFVPGPSRSIRCGLRVDGATATRMVTMGPAAHHVTSERLATVAAAQEVEVTLAVELGVHRRP